MRIVYFDCFMGISGDMTLGALIDAGVKPDVLQEQLSLLGLNGYRIEISKKITGHIAATDVRIVLDTPAHNHGQGGRPNQEHTHRHLPQITEIIEKSALSGRIRETAVNIFKRLAEAEARVHGSTPEEVHFHEVGALDAIVDIVGSSICLELLGWPQVISSPMPTFYGYSHGAHGLFPLPSPAAAEILRGVPWQKLGFEGELVTPTGAAIIRETAAGFGPQPAMTVQKIGYGAGKSDFGVANALRVMIGEETAQTSPFITIIETNIDDLNPEFYDSVMERLFAAGALDVFFTPVQMKKNRPGTLLSTICEQRLADKIASLLLTETSTFGVRITQAQRVVLERRHREVSTEFGMIRIKNGELNGVAVSASPEYEDCKRAADKHGVPVRIVYAAAIAAGKD